MAIFEMVRLAIGGIQHVLYGVLPRLGRWYRVVVVDAYNHPEFASRLRASGVEVTSLGGAPARKHIGGSGPVSRLFRVAGRLPWLLLTAWRLRRWIRQHQPAVFCFNRLPAVRFFAPLLPKEGPALVYHAHGFTTAAEIGRRTARLLSRRFARVLAVSGKTADLLLEAGVDPSIVSVVYNAVDTESIRRHAADDGPPLPPRCEGAVHFLHVGQVVANKGQDLAIRALARVRQRGIDAQLWLCGDVPVGAETDFGERLPRLAAELGVGDHVCILGWRNDVPRIMAAADVCILPSVEAESFGLTLAEAMALEKPCIGSRRGGIPEVIDDGTTGLVVEPEEEALAGAMVRLAEAPDLRRQMGRAGRAKADRLFDINRQAEEISRHLDLALGRAGAGRTAPRRSP